MHLPAPTARHIARPALLGMALAAALAVPSAASAASVTPDLAAGNPSCEDLGADWSSILKLDPPNDGNFPVVEGFIDVVRTGESFDWTSTRAVRAVIVKGLEGANVYEYAPGATGDTELNAPLTPDAQLLTHIEFCDGPAAQPEIAPGVDPQPEPKSEPTPQPEPQHQAEQPAAVVAPAAEPAAAAIPTATPYRAIAASSKLTAPGSCVRRAFKVSVSGKGIASVTFSVNGKVLRRQRGLSARVPLTGRVQRIRARVRYVAGATRTAETLKAIALRCSQA